MLFRVLALVLLLASQAAAELTVIDMGNGTCLLTDIVDNRIVKARVLPLVRLDDLPPPGGGPSPNPNPNPNPDPGPSQLTVKVREWTSQVSQYSAKATHQQKISDLYESIGNQVSNGSLETVAALAALSVGTDTLLGSDAGKWSSLRSKISEELTVLAQEGTLSDKAKFAKVLKEIAAGLK